MKSGSASSLFTAIRGALGSYVYWPSILIIKFSAVKKVYIETTIISYLTAKPSKNVLAAAWQELTREWWDRRRLHFDLFTSELVRAESYKGDAEAARRRLNFLEEIPILTTTDSAVELARKMINEGPLPEKAIDDALHIALSAVHRIDYLMTWNFKHIDNAEMKPSIRELCMLYNHYCPEICTPQELMGEG